MENKNETADALQNIVELCGYYDLNEKQIDVLVKYINRNYLTLTGPEIEKMFEFAVNGKLGIELKAKLSAKEFTKVILAYKKMFYKQQPNAEPEVTEEKKQQLRNEWLEYVCRKIEEFFKTGEYKLLDFGNPLYFVLESAGIIKFSLSEKIEFRKQAQGEIKRIDTLASKTPAIQIIIAKGDNEIEAVAKRIALQHFLGTCKQSGRDIISEIKSYMSGQEYELEEKSFK